MEEGRASRTALEVAIRRAAHQLLDQGSVFQDPLAVAILDDRSRARLLRGRLRSSEAPARAWMAARSRIAEETLSQAVGAGVDQYVVLGAGLDTFAYRNPYSNLQTFEVDYPATQVWKRARLAEAGIAVPKEVVYAPVDFERQSLREGLEAAGFTFDRPAFVTWLGVAMYLTEDAFRVTVETLGNLPQGSGVVLDYVAERESLGWIGKIAYDALARRVSSVGEPLTLSFTSERMVRTLKENGFSEVEDLDSNAVADRVLANHPGSFWLRRADLGHLATAWR